MSATPALPAGVAPRCLSREQAAEYVSISPGTFDSAVKAGKLPKAIPFGRRRVWDKVEIDRALDRIARGGESSSDEDDDDPFVEGLRNGGAKAQGR